MRRDKIILKNLKFFGYHGVLAQEKNEGQWFEVDLELTGDFSAAAQSDDLEKALDYRQIYLLVQEIMEGPSQNLLEKLTKEVILRLQTISLVEETKVLVKKLHPPLGGPAEYAAVEMTGGKGCV